MRIAMLTNNRFPAREGIGHHIKAVAEGLQRRGHEVIVVSRGDLPSAWSQCQCNNLLVRSYPHWPVKPFHHVADCFQLGRWLRAHTGDFDLIHLHLPLFAPLETGIPLVATFHSPMLTDNAAIHEVGLRPWAMKLNARLLSRSYEQWYLDHAQALVAVSKGVRAELEAHYHLSGRHLDVIGNAVDTEFFKPDNHPRGDHILYIGRLSYRKGLSRLLEALSILPEHKNRKLEMIGSGPLEADLKRQAKALGIDERVIFRGHQDHEAIREALLRAALFVNPADYETGPLTLLEAMATRTPVVSTETGLVAEMGTDPPLWLAPIETEGLAASIDQAWCERRTSNKPARARELVLNNYSWDRRIDDLEQLYERVLRWQR